MAEHWNGGSGGKGSRPRPLSVSQEEFDNRFDAIFGKKKKTEGEKQAEAFLKDEYYDLEEEANESDSLEQESVSVLRSGQKPA
jgi:hypothetical protein